MLAKSQGGLEAGGVTLSVKEVSEDCLEEAFDLH